MHTTAQMMAMQHAAVQHMNAGCKAGIATVVVMLGWQINSVHC
jgi:hypothetical protein